MKYVFFVSFLFSHFLQAQTFDYAKKWGIGGSAGYSFPVFGNDFNDANNRDINWSAHLRYHHSNSCGVELAFTDHDFDNTDQSIKVADILLFKRLSPLKRFTPVIGAGAGAADISNYNPSSLKLGLKLRAGAEYALNKDFSLGLNVDYQHISKMISSTNLPNESIHVLAAKLGLTWYFGGAATSSNQVVALADKDSDNDGVVDSKDKCPNTKSGIDVNDYGCAAEEKATVRLNVKFATGKANIAAGYDQDLIELASFMSEHQNTKIEVQGHTDNSGSKAINKKLSQARADAVKSYLVDKLKVDASRIVSTGYGDEAPVADNSTNEGKQQNRRVIAVINE